MSTAAPTDGLQLNSRSVVLTVSALIHETAEACSIVFDVPPGLEEKLSYRPGQFLTLRVPSDETGSVARCYSLSSSPAADKQLKVTVKRTRGGYGSNWLCDNISEGSTVVSLTPSGTFSPKSFDRNFLLFAAGSGITPVMSILKTALLTATGRVILVYANRDDKSVIFAEELKSLAAQYPRKLTIIHWLETLQGLPDAGQLATLAAPYSHYEVFMCGPAPFMNGVHEAVANVGFPRGNVHAEIFSSLAGDPFMQHEVVEFDADKTAGAASLTVELDGETHTLQWARNQTLVDALLSKGIDVPYSCLEGECGSCACTVLKGNVEMPQTDILDPEDVKAGFILGCQARPLSDELEIEF
ncbi:ferredoxin--NADP reductase [Rhodococcoides fascians]|uniref:ferredoxin--NADP reductase n=1 Tax=Rhodococcoides fascians TaxID=1828 RepID=UPI0006897F4B|nr:ferredoxin--NADP reductase [Rhodococcus fascians]